MDNAFYERIEKCTAHRESRYSNADYVLSNRNLFPDLIAVAFTVSDRNHRQALYILDSALESDLLLLSPYLDQFCRLLAAYSDDGAIRSVSRICLFLSERHSKSGLLSESQSQAIAEQCFDWLIGDFKVAAKAYAMYALYELGKSQPWIYPELPSILHKDFAGHSAGYRAAAKKVLRLINR